MAERAENIKRIMSSFLRMVGGRISWIAGVLHIRNEEDTDYQDVAANKAELKSISIKNSDRTKEVNLSSNPLTNYNIVLPENPPNIGDTLEVTDNSGNSKWSNINGIPKFDEFNMSYAVNTYTLSFTPNNKPIQAYINGIQVDFTVLANTITITSYSIGDIEDTDVLRVFYYY